MEAHYGQEINAVDLSENNLDQEIQLVSSFLNVADNPALSLECFGPPIGPIPLVVMRRCGFSSTHVRRRVVQHGHRRAIDRARPASITTCGGRETANRDARNLVDPANGCGQGAQALRGWDDCRLLGLGVFI